MPKHARLALPLVSRVMGERRQNGDVVPPSFEMLSETCCIWADAECGVVNVKKFASWISGAPNRDARRGCISCLDALADQCRNDVGRSRIEIVSGSIQIRGQQVNCVKTVLRPISLGLDQQRFLGQAVWSIRLLGVAVPQVILFERHRGEFGVGAHRTHLHELGHRVLARLLHQEDAHDRVVIEEAAGILAVGTDSSNPGSEVDNYVGALVGVHPNDVRFFGEVVLGTAEGVNFGRFVFSKQRDQTAAYEAVAARYRDTAAGPPCARDITSWASRPSAFKSGSTITRTSSWNHRVGFQPSRARALLESHNSVSTSAGRVQLLSMRTYFSSRDQQRRMRAPRTLEPSGQHLLEGAE